MAKYKKITIWLFIVAVIVVGLVFYSKSKKPTITYTTSDVIRGTLEQTVSVTGEINPETQFNLAFKIAGTVNKMVEVGTQVNVDQEIASLDKSSLILQYQAALKDITYQQKTLSAMKKNTATFNKQQRAAQQALVEKSQIAQSISQENIDDASIFSPIDGIVIASNYQQGEIANPGAVAISVITKDLVIESKVPESDIVKLGIGQHAKITFDALSDEDVFDSEVIEIDPASTTIQDVVYYNIKLKLDSADERIKPGMTANIDIKTSQRENAIIVPMRAIKSDGDKKYVEVLKKVENVTEKVYIVTGLEGDEGMVEVKSGLKGGEKVVTFVTTK